MAPTSLTPMRASAGSAFAAQRQDDDARAASRDEGRGAQRVVARLDGEAGELRGPQAADETSKEGETHIVEARLQHHG